MDLLKTVDLVEQAVEAWKTGFFAKAWRIQRQLARRNRGPKQRNYNIPRLAETTMQEVEDLLTQPAVDGGMGGVVVNFEERLQLLKENAQLPTPQPITPELAELINDDVKRVRWAV